jgi:hypothetical protein
MVSCDDQLGGLPPPSSNNVVDTIQLFALHGTAISQPSGFHLPTQTVWRTDQPGFDIAFDIDVNGNAFMYPAGALGLSRDPGIQKVSTSFDEVTSAPAGNDYATTTPVVLLPGTVFVVRSAPWGGNCGILNALPRYGKFHVISLDLAQGRVVLEILINVNCGYRDLRPGLPAA